MKPADLLAVIAAAASAQAAAPEARALLEAQARRAESAGFAMVTDVSDRPVHGNGGAGDVRFGEAS